MQINSAKSISRPPDEYKFAVEMNVSLEHKLEKCQAEIFSLKHQLSRKNEELAKLESEISSIKEKSMFSKDLTHEFHEFSPRYAETSCFVEDFKGLLEKFRKSKEKYKRCKGEKREIFANFERMKERVIQLSAQVQSDQYLIKHLKEKGSRFDKGLADSRSSSSLRLKMNKEL
jgi:peptidoglycan hydrolase CwlO-like protein